MHTFPAYNCKHMIGRQCQQIIYMLLDIYLHRFSLLDHEKVLDLIDCKKLHIFVLNKRLHINFVFNKSKHID